MALFELTLTNTFVQRPCLSRTHVAPEDCLVQIMVYSRSLYRHNNTKTVNTPGSYAQAAHSASYCLPERVSAANFP